MDDERLKIVVQELCALRECLYPNCECMGYPAKARHVLHALRIYNSRAKALAPSPDAALAAAAARWAKSETDPDRLAVARALVARFGG